MPEEYVASVRVNILFDVGESIKNLQAQIDSISSQLKGVLTEDFIENIKKAGKSFKNLNKQISDFVKKSNVNLELIRESKKQLGRQVEDIEGVASGASDLADKLKEVYVNWLNSKGAIVTSNRLVTLLASQISIMEQNLSKGTSEYYEQKQAIDILRRLLRDVERTIRQQSWAWRGMLRDIMIFGFILSISQFMTRGLTDRIHSMLIVSSELYEIWGQLLAFAFQPVDEIVSDIVWALYPLIDIVHKIMSVPLVPQLIAVASIIILIVNWIAIFVGRVISLIMPFALLAFEVEETSVQTSIWARALNRVFGIIGRILPPVGILQKRFEGMNKTMNNMRNTLLEVFTILKTRGLLTPEVEKQLKSMIEVKGEITSKTGMDELKKNISESKNELKVTRNKVKRIVTALSGIAFIGLGIFASLSAVQDMLGIINTILDATISPILSRWFNVIAEYIFKYGEIIGRALLILIGIELTRRAIGGIVSIIDLIRASGLVGYTIFFTRAIGTILTHLTAFGIAISITAGIAGLLISGLLPLPPLLKAVSGGLIMLVSTLTAVILALKTQLALTTIAPIAGAGIAFGAGMIINAVIQQQFNISTPTELVSTLGEATESSIKGLTRTIPYI